MQVIFPLDLGLKLPEDDSLRLLIEITEEMDFRELYAAYERREAAGEATAKQLFQLVVFGFMNGHYSLRSISAACGYDIRMMYLLQGKKIPYSDPRYFKDSASNPENASLLNWASNSASIVQSSRRAHLAFLSRIRDSGAFCAEVRRTFTQKS